VKTASIAAVALAAALSLAACSSSSDTAATPAASSASASAAAPAETPAPVETVAPSEEPMTGETIFDMASTADGFATLTAAITAAGLAEDLQGAGPVTVFAPTDDAFAALPAGVLDALLLPENQELLIKILTYHVIQGNVLSTDIVDGDVPTAEGQNVTLKTGEFVTVNGSKVIAADVVASNGVIHGIDAVLLPPDVDVDALLAN
jgi:uncharacterized surface protein with fasciclin (FAS1) repeats